jgi:ABC-type nickel/cobalt efflux system permease component RcnA
MNWTIVLIIVIVLAALWLVTVGLWWLLRLVGRKTGLDDKVDHAFDTEGELDPSDYLKFKEQHRHNEHHHL